MTSISELTVRELTGDDAEAFRAARARALESDPEAFGENIEEWRAQTLEAIRERMREGIESGLRFIIGAFDGGELAGMMACARESWLNLRHKGVIWGVFVAPEYRGRSVGAMLLDELIRRARLMEGLEQLALAVGCANEPAMRLYVSRGFRTFGVERRAMRVGGRYVDEAHMVLSLIPMPQEPSPIDKGGTEVWNEQDSREFIDLGRYAVPDRERQIGIIGDLVGRFSEPFTVLELCCGDGLLAEALLRRFPNCSVYGLDASETMLAAARERMAGYGSRFTAGRHDLADDSWRSPAFPVDAVVSSLAIHHLDTEQKRKLYRDARWMLSPGGRLVVADLILPADDRGVEAAAAEWDAAVHERSLALDGTTEGFERFKQIKWNYYRFPDPLDQPSGLFEQLLWLRESGFADVDVYWMRAGHAIYGGRVSS